MSEPDPSAPEFSTAAERELHRKLEDVRSEAPETDAQLEERVARTLRWQAILVVPLHAGLALAGGVLAGVRALGGGSRG